MGDRARHRQRETEREAVAGRVERGRRKRESASERESDAARQDKKPKCGGREDKRRQSLASEGGTGTTRDRERKRKEQLRMERTKERKRAKS